MCLKNEIYFHGTHRPALIFSSHINFDSDWNLFKELTWFMFLLLEDILTSWYWSSQSNHPDNSAWPKNMFVVLMILNSVLHSYRKQKNLLYQFHTHVSRPVSVKWNNSKPHPPSTWLTNASLSFRIIFTL